VSLLEGLEVSEVMLSDIKSYFENFRIDSEFFKKEYISINSLIESKDYEPLGNIVAEIIHPTEILREYSEEGIRILLAQNVRNNTFDFSNIVYMDESNRRLLERNKIDYDDIPLTRSGANYGQSACFKIKDMEIYACADLLLIKNSNKIKGGYLSTFFNSKFGRTLLNRGAYGMAQPHIAPTYLRTLNIPRLGKLETEIDNLVERSFGLTEQSQSLYNQAEDVLLNAIGMKGFAPTSKSANIKTFKESFLATGRLDAEYYQPKYEEIENKVTLFKDGFSYVYKMFRQNKTVIDYSEWQYNYIEIGDIDVGNGSCAYNMIGIDELPDNAKIMSKQGDVLVSKVRPNRGAVSIISENIANLVVSGAFTVLEENGNYKKEVLFVLLRTSHYKEWLLKYNVGTSYPVIKDEDVLNMPIPLIDKETQKQIANLIKESFALRAQSERLLDEAKSLVEREIDGLV